MPLEKKTNRDRIEISRRHILSYQASCGIQNETESFKPRVLILISLVYDVFEIHCIANTSPHNLIEEYATSFLDMDLKN